MVPWSAGVHVPGDPMLDEVADVLDPVLAPLGFARGQLGFSESEASVIFCRGDDGACIDLVVDLRPHPAWRITDVRYWGFKSECWHLAFPANGDLGAQIAVLSRTLPTELAERSAAALGDTPVTSINRRKRPQCIHVGSRRKRGR